MASGETSVKYEAVNPEEPEVPANKDVQEASDGGEDAPVTDAAIDNTDDDGANGCGQVGAVDGAEQQNDEDRDQAESTKGSQCCWLNKTDCLLYSSQALAAWGDRMWTFAVALFLVELEDNSLRLTAIFGFALAISVLMFGALVGRWVDGTQRLKAARMALLSQNSFVILNAIILLFLLRYKEFLFEAWRPGLYLLSLLVILIGVLANLCSQAQKICIQKDWVVVLAGDDREKLAEMNAMIRRIDLSVNILAPIIVGLIMNFAGMTIAAIYIAVWNVGSMIAEYNLLLQVYKKMPALARKAGDNLTADKQVSKAEREEMIPPKEASSSSPDAPAEQQSQPEEPKVCCRFCPESVTTTYKAWKNYKSYTVSWAGMGIAMFYMTVMGFDSITNGYGYSIGVPEYMIGVMRALGSIAGIMGTLLFPIMHKRVGLERTGLYAVSFIILCLSICVGSIWAPGSPFDPFYYQRTGYGSLPTVSSTPKQYVVGDGTGTPQNTANDLTELIDGTLITEIVTVSQFTSSLVSTPIDLVTPTIPFAPSTIKPQNKNIGGKECVDYLDVEHSYWTAVLFFGGQILQRTGLWVFDLVVTQSIQENIKENERGVFNGVQRSLECSMDMLHFILVILLPCPATFGYHILLSFLFVVCGSLLYSIYSHKIRGHLFHPEKLICHSAHHNGGSAIPNGDASAYTAVHV